MVMLYEAYVTDPKPDSSRPGCIKARIPELFGKESTPFTIEPMFPGSGSGWQSSMGSKTPDGEDQRVLVVRTAHETFRWMGTSQAWDAVMGSAGKVAGARSGNGNHHIKLDDDNGAELVSTGSGAKTVIGGPKIHLCDGETTPTDPFILSRSYMTDMQAVLSEIVTGLAVVPFTATQTAAMAAKISTSLASGAPYLSTRIMGD